jgi:carboxypeptidase C (cathepsin A)
MLLACHFINSLQGGPGCSSEIALFGENGPCKVSDDGMTTTLNPYSWNNNASIIFIDQPAGTGFSFGDHDHNEAGVAQDMYEFLTEFFDYFEKFQKNKFFIFGESYAGHYVPATSHRVWLGNKRKESDVHINLAGVAVGNGLTDPEIQYKYYPLMVCVCWEIGKVWPCSCSGWSGSLHGLFCFLLFCCWFDYALTTHWLRSEKWFRLCWSLSLAHVDNSGNIPRR